MTSSCEVPPFGLAAFKKFQTCLVQRLMPPASLLTIYQALVLLMEQFGPVNLTCTDSI